MDTTRTAPRHDERPAGQDLLARLNEKAKEYCFAFEHTDPAAHVADLLVAAQDADRWLCVEDEASPSRSFPAEARHEHVDLSEDARELAQRSEKIGAILASQADGLLQFARNIRDGSADPTDLSPVGLGGAHWEVEQALEEIAGLLRDWQRPKGTLPR